MSSCELCLNPTSPLCSIHKIREWRTNSKEVRLTSTPVRSLPVQSSRIVCPIEELYELAIPDRAFLVRKLDRLGVAGRSTAYFAVS